MALSKEAVRLKVRNNVYLPLTKKRRCKKLKHTDFTIISNNCWGGTIYESYGLRKMSPTIGMFIMPEDYLKFISNLKHYVSLPLSFICPEESKWKIKLENKKNWQTYVIGKIGDIELHMLHYHDEEKAKEKWESRVKRINWDRMIYKFNDQNEATKEQIQEFINLPMEHKLCFVAKEEMRINDHIILIRQRENTQDGIKASREPFGRSRYLNVTEYINGL